MFARPFVGFVVLALALVVGAMAALAQSPTPTPLPTATASSATPTPFVTPVGCGFFASPTPATGLPPNPSAPGSPAVPTDLRAELVDDPELASGFAVHLTWQDNADNETCFGVAVRIQGALIGVIGLSPGLDGSTTGPMTLKHVPVFTGPFCYQVYYGNGAGQSYSNEACINVEVLPVWATATPMPPTVETPMPSPPAVTPTPPPWPCELEDPPYSELGPAAPTNLVATLIADAMVPGGYRVELTWQDNATDALCFKVQSRLADGTWHWFTGGTGSAEIAVDAQPVPGECYRVWVANEHGRSDYSNEACATGPAVTVTPTPVTPVALPFTGGGHE